MQRQRLRKVRLVTVNEEPVGGDGGWREGRRLTVITGVWRNFFSSHMSDNESLRFAAQPCCFNRHGHWLGVSVNYLCHNTPLLKRVDIRDDA